MVNKDLLAATAVFAELVNNDIDYKDVINSFIFSVYSLEKKYSMNSQEVCLELSNHYDFNIPEAVIKSQLNTLFKKEQIEYLNGNYIVSPETISNNSKISTELKEKNNLQNKIFEGLISFIELFKGKLDSKRKEEVNVSFTNYLFDDNSNGEYSDLISNYILKNSNDEDFKNELNLIREGIIILRGLKYSSENEEGFKFKNELNIYLDTEHLFSINGYNGEIHKKILLDFYDIIRDLNVKQSSKKIHLKFFEEAKHEINNFFASASEIFEKKRTKDISNEAMKFILNGISSKSDILRKEANFFQSLKNMGISETESIEIPEEEFAKFNVESKTILEKYSSNYEEENIIDIMKCFTRINYLRKGDNKNTLENIKHILVSGDTLTRKISRDIDTRIDETDFSFATDIYYITNRLWFKNNKGFGFKGKIPTTLDVVSKAQVILSNKLINVIRDRFELIKNDVEKGIRTEDEVKSFYASLVSKSLKPEDLSSENIDEKTKILFDFEDIEAHIRQESLMKQKLAELEKFKTKVETEKKSKKEKKLKEKKEKRNNKIYIHNKKIETKILFVKIIYYLIPAIIILLIIYTRKNEKFWDILDTIIYVIPFLFWLGFWKTKDKIISKLNNNRKVIEN